MNAQSFSELILYFGLIGVTNTFRCRRFALISARINAQRLSGARINRDLCFQWQLFIYLENIKAR